MALDFPSSPTNGQTYTYGSVTYYYDSGNISWTTSYVAPPSFNLTPANNWSNTKVASVTSNSNSRIWANTSIDGNSNENVYLDLSTSGVTATTYGGATQIPVVAVDAYGRVTSASNVSVQGMDYAYANSIGNNSNTWANTGLANVVAGAPISITWSKTNNFINATINIATSGVTASTYGNATIIPVITVDSYGRVTSAANVTAAGGGSGLANTSGISFIGDLYFPAGNIGVGSSSSSGYRLYVNGSFAANTKSFVIDHPTKSGMKLRYGSLEGPENGVYVRGKIDGSNVIELPDYWDGLVNLDTISVSLTSIGHAQNLYVAAIDGLKIHIDTENHTQPYCYYHVYAERKDVEKLVVEY